MKTRKYFLFAAALVLVAGLGFSALAQSKAKGSFAKLPSPREVTVPVVSINAIGVSDGIVGFDNRTKEETAFGYTFLGRSTGSFPGSFTLSMNCTPVIPVRGNESAMTGGSWTLPVYMMEAKGGGAYMGSLYGTVAKGTMIFDKMGNATVYFVLDVTGGTQTWDGVNGYATFSGILFINEKNGQKTLLGDLVFSILPTK